MMSFFSPQIPLGGVVLAFEQSDFACKIVVVVLFLGSILAWTVMAAKTRELRVAAEETLKFVAEYRRQESPLGLYLQKNRSFEGSPVHAVYAAAVAKLSSALDPAGADGRRTDAGRMAGGRVLPAQMNAVRIAAERTLADQAMLLENQMGMLATSVTTAPFLGLLGTVWGVMDAFSGMAVSGAPMLSNVAPGISGALLTTVFGLLVALPSSIGYNLLSDRIRRLCVQMDTFAQEFLSDVERRYLAGV